MFLKGLAYMEMVTVHLGHVLSKTILTNFRSPNKGGSTLNIASIGPVASEQKIFEKFNDRQTTDSWLYFQLNYEPNGTGGQKILKPTVLVAFCAISSI